MSGAQEMSVMKESFTAQEDAVMTPHDSSVSPVSLGQLGFPSNSAIMRTLRQLVKEEVKRELTTAVATLSNDAKEETQATLRQIVTKEVQQELDSATFTKELMAHMEEIRRAVQTLQSQISEDMTSTMELFAKDVKEEFTTAIYAMEAELLNELATSNASTDITFPVSEDES